jgi:hypothetical protein
VFVGKTAEAAASNVPSRVHAHFFDPPPDLPGMEKLRRPALPIPSKPPEFMKKEAFIQ